jgi:hypothetical protein
MAYDSACSDTNPSWSPVRLTSNPYHNSICFNTSLSQCDECTHEFSISPSGVITFSMESGTVLISYLGYPEDEEGYALIPDDESLKEAIFHYVLYRYWLQKDMMKEEGAEKRMKFHLDM